MKLLMYGFNKYTVTSQEDGYYALDKAELQRQLADISQMDGNLSVVIFNNEFRTEYYMKVDEDAFNHGDFLRYLSDKLHTELSETISATYSMFNQDLIEHLIYILSGRGEEDQSFSQLFNQADNSLRLALPFQKKGEDTFYGLFAGVMKLAIQFLSQQSHLNADLLSKNKPNLLQFINGNQMDRVVLFGDNDYYPRLAKDLYLLGVKSIVMISDSLENLQDETNQLNTWQNSLFPDDGLQHFKSYSTQEGHYFVSSADGLIFSNETAKEYYGSLYTGPTHAMRLFDKKQASIVLDDMTAKPDIENATTKPLTDVYENQQIDQPYAEDNFEDYFAKKIQDFSQSVLNQINE